MAYCSGEAMLKVLNWCTLRSSRVSCGGATQYPTRQPVACSVLPKENTAKLRSRSSGCASTEAWRRPSIEHVLIHLVGENRDRAGRGSRRRARPNPRASATVQLGFCGLLMMISRVRSLKARRTSSQSKRKAGGESAMRTQRAARQPHGRIVGVVGRIENDGFIAGADDGLNRVVQRLGAAAGHGDLGVRIKLARDSCARAWRKSARAVRPRLPSAHIDCALRRPLRSALSPSADRWDSPGNPWPMLSAPSSSARRDITVNIVVPTSGNLLMESQESALQFLRPPASERTASPRLRSSLRRRQAAPAGGAHQQVLPPAARARRDPPTARAWGCAVRRCGRAATSSALRISMTSRPRRGRRVERAQRNLDAGVLARDFVDDARTRGRGTRRGAAP